ncbi:hypothetical protein [Azohydromonas lata]|uniref:Uncharacterized protein n=1 Tax=Azohydromonas lata TaxID=45677 RepID=A0ABU5IAR6_9BURK|nr:hypothetical protein [Azohydromonas lata]MDZ5455073.1 hypothetical protein [Azohydromonas lata]
MAARETDTKTKISNDGLRYTAKKPGSIFGSVTMGSASATMSCFKCGQHRPVSELVTKKILGRNQKVCAGSCQRRA